MLTYNYYYDGVFLPASQLIDPQTHVFEDLWSATVNFFLWTPGI